MSGFAMRAVVNCVLTLILALVGGVVVYAVATIVQRVLSGTWH